MLLLLWFVFVLWSGIAHHHLQCQWPSLTTLNILHCYGLKSRNSVVILLATLQQHHCNWCWCWCLQSPRNNHMTLITQVFCKIGVSTGCSPPQCNGSYSFISKLYLKEFMVHWGLCIATLTAHHKLHSLNTSVRMIQSSWNYVWKDLNFRNL